MEAEIKLIREEVAPVQRRREEESEQAACSTEG